MSIIMQKIRFLQGCNHAYCVEGRKKGFIPMNISYQDYTIGYAHPGNSRAEDLTPVR